MLAETSPAGSLLLAAAGAATSAESTQQIIETAYAMACRAAELGAMALLVYPPVAFRDEPDLHALLIRYHTRIAKAGLPLMLFYLYEAAGGISYTPKILLELLAQPEVLGIKIATLDSVMTFQDIARLVRAQAPGKLVITGEDRFLGYSLMCGTNRLSLAWLPHASTIQADLLRTHLQGPLSRVSGLCPLVDDLAQHTFRAPWKATSSECSGAWCTSK